MKSNFAELYRSPRTLSFAAIGFLAASLTADAILAILGGGQLFFPYEITLNDGEPISFWMVPIGLFGIFEILVYIGSIVFFLMWLYRCCKNLPALKSRNIEYTPGWAVGWWFIPLANLFKPLGVVTNLWNESDPDFDAELNFLSNNSETPNLLYFWWGFWLVGNFVSNLSGRLADSEKPEDLRAFSIALMTAAVLGVAAAALAIAVVKRITDRQEARFSKINGSTPEFAPSSPPQFG